VMLLVAFAMSSGATTSTKATPIHEANHHFGAITNDCGYIFEPNVVLDRSQADSPFRIELYAQLILRALLLLAATLFIGSTMVFAIRDRNHPSATATAPESPGTIGLRASPLLEI
jgi:hypothetical protein